MGERTAGAGRPIQLGDVADAVRPELGDERLVPRLEPLVDRAHDAEEAVHERSVHVRARPLEELRRQIPARQDETLRELQG